jgi:hypothetical protein
MSIERGAINKSIKGVVAVLTDRFKGSFPQYYGMNFANKVTKIKGEIYVEKIKIGIIHNIDF